MTVVRWFGLSLLVAAQAHAGSEPDLKDVIVRVRHGNVAILAPAEAEAARVLRQAHVRLKFERLDPNRAPDARLRECGMRAPRRGVIDLSVLDQTPETEHPGAFGYAMPFGSFGVRVVIFHDRVSALQRGPELLGHVMAHEIVHVLLGTSAHAESGLMRAQWTLRDVAEMKWRPLPISDIDINLIAYNLAGEN